MARGAGGGGGGGYGPMVGCRGGVGWRGGGGGGGGSGRTNTSSHTNTPGKGFSSHSLTSYSVLLFTPNICNLQTHFLFDPHPVQLHPIKPTLRPQCGMKASTQGYLNTWEQEDWGEVWGVGFIGLYGETQKGHVCGYSSSPLRSLGLRCTGGQNSVTRSHTFHRRLKVFLRVSLRL